MRWWWPSKYIHIDSIIASRVRCHCGCKAVYIFFNCNMAIKCEFTNHRFKFTCTVFLYTQWTINTQYIGGVYMFDDWCDFFVRTNIVRFYTNKNRTRNSSGWAPQYVCDICTAEYVWSRFACYTFTSTMVHVCAGCVSACLKQCV